MSIGIAVIVGENTKVDETLIGFETSANQCGVVEAQILALANGGIVLCTTCPGLLKKSLGCVFGRGRGRGVSGCTFARVQYGIERMTSKEFRKYPGVGRWMIEKIKTGNFSIHKEQRTDVSVGCSEYSKILVK